MGEGITENKRRTGADREQKAAAYLQGVGVKIIEKNFRCQLGEIDLIGIDGEYLVFIEVKYRKSKSCGEATEAVGIGKQRKICRVADYYRVRKKLSDNVCVRYDVVGIQGDKIEWIPNAFPHRYEAPRRSTSFWGRK